MRKVNFKVRNIGSEKYLSYILDDDCDFDEELLDYFDENKIPELIDIIYEEDDVNDYLTYNVTGRTTVETLFAKTVNAEMVLGVLHGIASGIVNMRDLGIPVSDVILHKGFTYVNPVTYDVKMICIPVESDTNPSVEFKRFAKDLLVNTTYDSAEDCNYVAKVISLLNVDKFTVRAFAAQLAELMEAAGMQVEEDYMDVGGTGVEVTGSVDTSAGDSTTMDDLPEFNEVSFDDEDGEEISVYDTEPAKANEIFKDLDLDAEEKKESSSVDMSVFDDSMLEELEIDEDIEEALAEEETAEADALQEEPEEEAVQAAPEQPEVSEQQPEDVQGEPEQPHEDVQEEPVDAASDAEGLTEMLTDIQESGMTEIAETAEGVTEVSPKKEDTIKPILIDTSDLDNLIDEPPVVKNIKVNRAKIIQHAVEEAAEEEEEKVDNPTEQIISQEFLESGEPVEPETNMDPVSGKKSRSQSGKTTTDKAVELSAGMNVVKDTEPEEDKHAASGMPKAMPYIVRVNTGERVMINKPVFKLGKATRGVDFSITGNGAISRVHAIINTKDSGCYLKDNKATNATYVDGVKLEENQEVKLRNDSTITLGGEDFLFKLS